MFLRVLRRFSFKPTTPLVFKDKKALIVKNKNLETLKKYFVTGFIGVPGLMLYRLLAHHTTMGWLNFIFSLGTFAGTSAISKAWLNTMSSLVTNISLMDDGKTIEINTFSIGIKANVIKIKDIINPEENLGTKVKMQYFNTWVIETNKGETYHILPNSDAYEKEVLKAILKGEEVEVKESIEKTSNNDNVIDI
ncbi:hypothetical protein SteCoe_16961 [Stentor coeruleus]|uniref:Uncharacterized protein n=1 Tax=Stentor coeruleus TaxID=5963 RepID=A0A1R2C053_9CILI|nr:hypothetical protein SteCoe_16961 [Stentor coeruleus]